MGFYKQAMILGTENYRALRARALGYLARPLMRLSRMARAAAEASSGSQGRPDIEAQRPADLPRLQGKHARDVMRPRTEVVALPEGASAHEVSRVVRAERYSRYPVFRESLDDVIGVFLAKDLWLDDGTKPFVLSDHVRPVPYVPGTRAAARVLEDLRRARARLAVVLDEYGGTSGILTLEDLVEVVIGDIDDEYDFATRQAVEANGVLELDGTMPLADVRKEFGLAIPEGDWNTLGGFVFGELGRLARMGDRVPIASGELEVVAMDGRRVAAVRVLARSATTSDLPGKFSDREVPL